MTHPRRFAAAALLALAAAAAARADYFALVVGVNEYAGERPPLRCAVNDATELADVLKRSGYDPANVELLTNAKATRARVLDRLDDTLAGRGPGDVVVVAFAGHGVRAGT